MKKDNSVYLQEEKKYEKNMFTIPLGDRYAKKFYNVYNAKLEDRDRLMKELYEEGKNDESLNQNQKKIIYGCYIAYSEAIGKNNIAMPLVTYIKTKKPNLTKCLNEKRLKRIIEDLYTFSDKTGFEFQYYNLFDLLKMFIRSFGKLENDEDNKDFSFELYLIIAISKYVRNLSVIAYPQMWFGLMLIKNISLLSFVNINLFNNEIANEAKNLINLINVIHTLEIERAGIQLKTKKEKDDMEKSVILPEEDIQMENNLIQENTELDGNTQDSEFNILQPESSYTPIITDISQVR